MVVRDIDGLPGLAGKVGFVPTMGALHEGHLSLIRAAKEECDHIVVSIFVNPLQFAPGEDFTRYPRPEQHDIELASSAGANCIFIPDSQSFTNGISTTVSVAGVSELYEGAHRPGHFDGVATVVAKLFNIVRPDFAYFGLKDRQQCAVIRRMVLDLNMGVILRFMDTMREPDGLAMSSRNIYLTETERRIAPELYKTLRRCRDEIQDEILNEGNISQTLNAATARLEPQGFAIDYLDLVDEQTFRPTSSASEGSVLVVAARLGVTRLIDNVSLLGD